MKALQLPRYLLISIIIHGFLALALLHLMPAITPAPSKVESRAIKSYLVLAKPVAVTNRSKPDPISKPIAPLPAKPLETKSKSQPQTQSKAEKLTKPTNLQTLEQKNQAMAQAITNGQSTTIKAEKPISSKADKSSTAAKFNPYSSASSYLQQQDQQQRLQLSQQSLQQLRVVKPLSQSGDNNRAEKLNQRYSERFAAKGSGVKVVAKLSHNETLVKVAGNCMKITIDNMGEQKWQGSTACRNDDAFDGQLQKSLAKYVKKRRIKE